MPKKKKKVAKYRARKRATAERASKRLARRKARPAAPVVSPAAPSKVDARAATGLPGGAGSGAPPPTRGSTPPGAAPPSHGAGITIGGASRSSPARAPARAVLGTADGAAGREPLAPRLGCLVRGPRSVFCYWELGTDARRREIESRVSAVSRTAQAATEAAASGVVDPCRWVIRVSPEHAPTMDIEIDPASGGRNIDLEPGGLYRMELGIVPPGGEFVATAASDEVETPAEGAIPGRASGSLPLRDEFERLVAMGSVGSSARASSSPGASTSGGATSGGATRTAAAARPAAGLFRARPSTGTPAPGTQGHLVLVLHCHLPYVRHPEHERFLEEDWLFEAITETYIPLAELFDVLHAEGVRPRTGVVMSPTLSEMLSDPVLQGRYEAHLGRLIRCADRELGRRKGTPFVDAASMYCERLRKVRDLHADWGGNPLGVFCELRDRGVVEIIACAATHGLLPLMRRPEAVRAQVEIGCRNHEKHFGRRPEGMWLPECAYRPGLDRVLAEAGLRYFFLDSHGVLFGRPVPEHLTYLPVRTPAGPVAFGRDAETSVQVWSADEGYPGDPVYREFYRDLGHDGDLEVVRECLQPDGVRRNIGLKYHSVTGRVPLEAKDPYDPAAARERAREHAEHFVSVCEERIANIAARTDTRPVICAMYDAELFGHWWYEGVDFLREVLRLAGRGAGPLEAVAPGELLRQTGGLQVVEPSASSWGNGGYFEHWVDGSNTWMYPRLHGAEERMVELARAFPAADGLARRALDQAARELLLAQSSDWAFLMATRTAPEYAERRTRDHLARFTRLCEMILAGSIDEADLADLERRDALFADIDYRVYG